MNKHAKFNIGDMVFHKRQGYRAVIVDIDPVFHHSSGTPHLEKNTELSETIWYRLLVDDSELKTYVKESMLVRDLNTDMVNNPHVKDYLELDDGQYRTTHQRH